MLRSVIAGLSVGLLVLLFGPLGILAALVSRSSKPIYGLARPLVGLFFRIAGVRLQVEGRQHIDPAVAYVFVPNHISNADPPAVFLAIGRDIRVLAKSSLFAVPIFGALLRIIGCVPVERGDREGAIESVEIAAASLRQGHDFLVFGEGTRSRDGQLLPFKKGPFVMAIRAQAPVAPMVVQGTREVWPRGSFRVHAGIVRVEFLAPVPTTGLGFEDRESLRLQVEQMVAAKLGQPAPSEHRLQ